MPKDTPEPSAEPLTAVAPVEDDSRIVIGGALALTREEFMGAENANVYVSDKITSLLLQLTASVISEVERLGWGRLEWAENTTPPEV